MTNFSYSALRSDELRLLRPISASIHGLYFDVVHTPQKTAPTYTAISYTWGTDKPTQLIYLDGKPFYIRLNLWSCLYYLSLASKRGTWKHMWADAICIDQLNDFERNAQVRKMDTIYRGAICVSVWLGLVPVADQYIHRVAKPIKAFNDERFDWSDSMKEIANRPYWSRAWVIQEFLLGRDVHLYCSGHRIDWIDFQTQLGFVADVDFLSTAPYDKIKRQSSKSYAAVSLCWGRHVDRHPELLQPLHTLLMRHRDSQCYDPRDRVFALLGLVTADEQRMLRRFLPDYRMSEDMVFIIALGHSGLFGFGEDINKDKLLRALGVTQWSRRRKLLGRLRHFDYLEPGSLKYFQETMDMWDDTESAQDEASDQTSDLDVPVRSSIGRLVKYTTMIIMLMLVAAMIWWRYMYLGVPIQHGERSQAQ